MPTLLASSSAAFGAELDRDPLVVVPVGALEAHGPHLPLGADQIQAEATCTALAERLGAWVAPTISFGSCPGARDFPGTVSVPLDALEAYVRHVLTEFARQGVRRLLVLSGHAERGHMAALREAADRTHRDVPSCRIVVLSDYDFVYELRGQLAPSTDGHGGMLETSRVMALAPETVGSERPVVEHRGSPFVPGPPSKHEWPESVQGDTRPANRELGERVQRHVLDRLESTVAALLPRTS